MAMNARKDRKKWFKNELTWQDEVYDLRKTVHTNRGQIEYATLGEGKVVMCMHGMPGGFDQGIMGFDWIADAGFRLLDPSRPGYLGTPYGRGVLSRCGRYHGTSSGQIKN